MTGNPRLGAKIRSRAIVDGALVVLATVVAFAVSGHVEFAERFADWAIPREHWQADELPTALMAALAGLVWFSLRRWREGQALQQRNQQLARHLMTVQESERREIARDIHDEFGQRCTALRIEARCILNRIDRLADRPTCAEVRESVSTMAESIALLQAEARRLVHRLRPAFMGDHGFSDCVRSLVDEWHRLHGIRVRLHALPDHLPEPVAIALYRVVQEALTNVAKHARASEVTITFEVEAGLLRLGISDDGRGFSAADPADPCGFGLRGIVERITELEGLVVIDGAGGVTLSITLPLPEPTP
jgi:two-component system sensor histidine kinase UhpB